MQNIKTINIDDKDYPENLKRLKKAPKQIYAIGNIELLNKENLKIAIVGARKNTEYGKNMGLNFAKKLSSKGIIIISGLASGIDSYAHIGAMTEKSKTIAVLPCGLQKIYPKENQKLYEVIIKNGGLVITEYYKDIEADSSKFTERNRIVAGLSNGVLVVEEDYRSGTRNTVKIAKELNLPIFCIPSNLESKKGYVPNLIIKNGGNLVTNENDIIGKIKNIESPKKEKKTKFEDNIENLFYKMYNIEKRIKSNYKIYEYITNNPIDVDELIQKTNMDIKQINYEITMLTIEEKIKELPGQKYVKINRLE